MPTAIIKIKVKPGRETDFEAVIHRLITESSANEPGLVFYQGFRAATPGEYIMLESFKDIEAHTASPHFQANRPALTDCFDGAPDVQRLTDL